jgi:hypothetical protein
MPIPPGAPAMRRQGGVRRETSDRVRFEVDGPEGARPLDGWALNISRGGVRVVVEDPVELGQELRVAVGEAEFRPGRIVWIQDEPGGAIVGVEFLDAESRSDVPGPPGTSQAPPDPTAGLAPPKLPTGAGEPDGTSG